MTDLSIATPAASEAFFLFHSFAVIGVLSNAQTLHAEMSYSTENRVGYAVQVFNQVSNAISRAAQIGAFGIAS